MYPTLSAALRTIWAATSAPRSCQTWVSAAWSWPKSEQDDPRQLQEPTGADDISFVQRERRGPTLARSLNGAGRSAQWAVPPKF